MPHTARDIDTLARTIWGEARNQGREGMIAVAWVIRNRVDIDLHIAGYAGLSVFKVAGLVGAVAQAYTYLMWALVMGLFAMHHEK
jgi:hypothetical protein